MDEGRLRPLPGGGSCVQLASRGGLIVVEQRRDDGWLYRWLLVSPSARLAGELKVQSVVRCRPAASRRPATRSMSFDRSWLAPQYLRAMIAALSLRPPRLRAPRRMLHLGGGAGVLPMAIAGLSHAAPVSQDVVECSADALALGRAHFGLAPDRALRLHAMSAEQFIAGYTGEAFDAVFLDICATGAGAGAAGHAQGTRAAGYQVPPIGWRGQALLSQLRALLRPGGLLLLNTLDLRRAAVAALREALVATFGRSASVTELRCAEEGNVLFVACAGALSPPRKWLSPDETQPIVYEG
jgi:hypothetical protein